MAERGGACDDYYANILGTSDDYNTNALEARDNF